MKRTKLDKAKLQLNAETLRMLTPEHLEIVQGGRCTFTQTGTFNNGTCTNACNSNPPYCTADTKATCALSAYC